MIIVVAMDSFKGSLSSIEANAAVERALKQHNVWKVPISDGGEGFLDAWLSVHKEARVIEEEVKTLDGQTRLTRYGWNSRTKEAVVEVAEASGITLVDRFDPLRYSSYGTGLQLRHAIERGAKRITVGLGGSATIDGGKGLLEALGVRFYSIDKKILQPFPAQLAQVTSVDWSGLMPEVKDIDWWMASDVTNPLLGELGSATVFGPQKGLSLEVIPQYDEVISSYASLFSKDYTMERGAGAAGGIGFALYQLGAKYVSGIEQVMRWVSLEEKLKRADWLITGEGRFDTQSLQGKAPYGLAKAAYKHGVPTIVFAGQTEETFISEEGILAVIPIISRVMTLEEAMSEAAPLLTNAVKRTFNIIDQMKSV